MGTFKDNLGNEYMDPYIPQKIVGFIGIDPDIVSGGSGGGGSGIDDHEQLHNLLGGDSTGHYHLSAKMWERLEALLSTGRVPTPSGYGYFYLWSTPSNPPIPGLDAYIDARIAEYMSQQNSGG